jgi:hypothetical protein
MNRIQRLLAGAMLLATTALSACQPLPAPPPLPTDATPAQVAAQAAAQKAAQTKADFTAVCKYGSGIWQVAEPIAAKAAAAKFGTDGTLAVSSLDTFVTVTCKGDLDPTSAASIIQHGYDLAGQVLVLVLAAQKS